MKNGRQPQKKENGRWPQFFVKLKLRPQEKWRGPQQKNEDDLKKNEGDLEKIKTSKKSSKINLNWLWHNSKLT